MERPMPSGAQKTDELLKIMQGQPVIPVLKIDRLADAVPLARALARGGLPAVEITLRTPVALDAIRAVAAEVPEAVVGAGTILNPDQFEEAVSAGAQFIVSPGTTPSLIDAAASSPVPLLPGAITPGELMAAAERGYSLLKFFPAEQAGGAAFLKALASPFAGIRFCPTGGIGVGNAADYLSLPNVICVGGSWVAPDGLVAEGKWDEIEALAKAAAALKS
jgi:2-dehydro-3-deoxyphosphogluconate aldolase/(4S)-4-hydroxy-2-oxoglutarate aldolase